MPEYLLRPRPGYDMEEVVRAPSVHNAVIFEYDHGVLKNIYPATRTNLYIFDPKPPPDYYRKQTVNGKEIPKVLPEGHFGTGSSPFIQALWKKASQYRSVSFGDLFRALTEEFRIMPKNRRAERMLRKLLDWINDNAGYIIRTKKGDYIAGPPPPVNIPLIKYTRGRDPIKEQICSLCESKHLVTYDEIREYIIDTLEWLTDTGYLNRCLRELVREGCLRRIGDDIYEFVRYPDLF